jgi:energy-coupling factor transporter ATP-binding protein EcfA2
MDSSLLPHLLMRTYGTRYRTSACRESIASLIATQLTAPNPLRSTSLLTIQYRDGAPWFVHHSAAAGDKGEVKSSDPHSYLLPVTVMTPELVCQRWCTMIIGSSPSPTDPKLIALVKLHESIRSLLLAQKTSCTQLHSCGAEVLFGVLQQVYDINKFANPVEVAITAYTSQTCIGAVKSNIRSMIISQLEVYSPASLPSISSDGHRPYMLTNEGHNTVRLVMEAMALNQSVLLVGPDGCGKSHLLRAIVATMGHAYRQLCVTPQTEAAALVGSFVPKKHIRGGRGGAEWIDGAVTEAAKNGHILIIDNISEAPAEVLERLNPILEQPRQWTLTENSSAVDIAGNNSQCTPIVIHPNFRILATMTPPTTRLKGVAQSTNNEFSPALANRFTIINVDGINGSSRPEEFHSIIRSCVPHIAESRALMNAIVKVRSSTTFIHLAKLIADMMCAWSN